MSEPTHQIPTTAEEFDSDPLLDTDAFIDTPVQMEETLPERGAPAKPEVEVKESPEVKETPENVEFPAGSVIAAQPISMVLPEDCRTEEKGKGKGKRKARDLEEMSKRPDWLPENWTMEVRVRTNGATAGLIDRYFFEPEGKHKFRSRLEVTHFLETGNTKLKRKAANGGDDKPSPTPRKQKKNKSGETSATPGTRKQRKSTGKGKKGASADVVHDPVPLNTVPEGTPAETIPQPTPLNSVQGGLTSDGIVQPSPVDSVPEAPKP